MYLPIGETDIFLGRREMDVPIITELDKHLLEFHSEYFEVGSLLSVITRQNNFIINMPSAFDLSNVCELSKPSDP
jgi:hypothetical protein